MSTPETDKRSPGRRAQDEQIATEPRKAPLDLPADAESSPLEIHLDRLRRPLAVAGVVENGVVRPLDPDVLTRELERLLAAPESLRAMGEAASKLARPDAAERVVESCAALLQGDR